VLACFALARPAAAVDVGSQIAVLPLHDLSGRSVPLESLHRNLKAELERRGLVLCDEDLLHSVMAKHRVRYTGGLAAPFGRTLADETPIRAVLVTSVDHYDAVVPPKIALTSRLVATGETAEILWADSVAWSGDQSPGFMGIGRIEDPALLEARALSSLAESLAVHLSGSEGRRKEKGLKDPGRRKFRPKSVYRPPRPLFGEGEAVRIAVLPFLNESEREWAGDLVALRFVEAMASTEKIDIIDPGDVRRAILEARLIAQDGISLPQADLLGILLDADLVLMGRVADYVDFQGFWTNPRVAFSVRVVDVRTRQVVWSSVSYNSGSEGVFFFDVGRVRIAHALATEMAGRVVKRMLAE